MTPECRHGPWDDRCVHCWNSDGPSPPHLHREFEITVREEVLKVQALTPGEAVRSLAPRYRFWEIDRVVEVIPRDLWSEKRSR